MKMDYWKQSEIDFIKEHYTKNGSVFCAQALNRTPTAICHKANRLNLFADKIEFAKRNIRIQEENFDKSGKPISSPEAWKKRVKRIFNFTCADCNFFCPTICVAHHIEEQHKAPHLKYELDNGVCLCPNCHALRHVEIGRKSAGKRISKFEKQQIRELHLAGYSVVKISKIIGINHKTVTNYK